MRIASSIVRSCIGSSLLLTVACTPQRAQPKPDASAPIEAGTSSQALAPGQSLPFVYTVESFADLRILRYRVRGFDALTRKQKTLLYYLQQAALSGRDITYDQKYVHNLAIRRTLEALVKHMPERQDPEYRALVQYLKRVWYASGVHHHDSSKKILPEGLPQETFAAWVRSIDAKLLPLSNGETVEALINKLTPAIFDPNVAAVGVSKSASGDVVSNSASNFYVNLTADQVKSYNGSLKHGDDKTPVSYGLNSQLIGKKDGSVEERPWRVGGMYGAALSECVRWLEQAVTVAENEAQAEALRHLIKYYQTGDLKEFDAHSIAWVKDTESSIDLIHGFIEVYGDPMGLRGTYESLVELVDKDATKRVAALSANAQWFEDNSPIAQAYKKPHVVGIQARVVESVLGAGDTAPGMPTGVNLPNSEWIREQHGSKSVTLGNVLEAYHEADRDSGVLEEFTASTRELTRARDYGVLARALLTDMHEVIGHASGRLKEGVRDPATTLGHYGSTLEEARADLVALYYLLDPKLIDLKLIPSLEVGRAAYDSYLRGSLVQLSRVALGETLEEAHMRNRQLVVHWVTQKGSEDGIVERIERGGKTYLVVREYPKLRKLFGQLLAEIQRIKSEGDYEAARDLVETHGVKIDPELHQQIRTRWDALRVPPFAGFLQPELKLVKQGDEITDVKLEYPADFAAQHLGYSERYSFLPTYN